MSSEPKDSLREFILNRSEEAFRTLVHEHSPMVLGTALRKLGGDQAAAQDVMQEVFTLLASKASGLESVVLGGWLYRQTCRRAANHMRSESRRKRREMAAVEMMTSPTPADALDSRQLARELDDALLSLPATDRDALVLRFFECKEYRAIGKLLGFSEEATRKRIQRAIDTLGGSLKRRGITASSVSLGSALEACGASPVSAETISQLTGTALKASAGFGSVTLAAVFNPMLAGVLATSLVTVSALAFRQPIVAPGSNATTPASKSALRTARQIGKFPEHPTLEQIIAEIRRIRSNPGNVLSTLRLKVVLGKIQISQIPEFVALGNERLNNAEREEIYQPLMTLWWDQDPDAAMTFVLREKIDEKMKQVGSNYLVGELFRRWAGRDCQASEVWLMRNWDDEVLRKTYGRGAFRNFLSMWITGDLFSRGDVDGIFAFSRRLPTTDDQAKALGNVVGMEPMHSMWTYADANQELWLNFYRGLEEFPDETWRRELTRHFWKNLGENHPDTVLKIQESFHPADPFTASLGLLCVRQLNGKPEQSLSGGTSMKSNPVSDRALREAATMEMGLAHGMPRGQVLAAMGEVLSDGMEPDEYFAWLDTHKGEMEFDDFLAKKAREKGIDSVSIGGPQIEAIQWASRISNAELRRSLCRAAFRRMLVRGPDIAKEYLDRGQVPEDLVAEFQDIATATP